MRWKNLPYLVVLGAVILGTIALYDRFFTRTRCEFGFLLRKNTFLDERFLSCSNIDQRVIGLSGVRDEASDVPGWRIYRPSRPNAPGTIHLEVRKDRDTAFFYPRVSGQDSSVVLAEPTVNIVREWVVLRGNDTSWTPVSRRYQVDLACLGQECSPDDQNVKIDLVLNGPWAQVWHKDEAVLF